jgi:hypothetical protein
MTTLIILPIGCGLSEIHVLAVWLAYLDIYLHPATAPVTCLLTIVYQHHTYMSSLLFTRSKFQGRRSIQTVYISGIEYTVFIDSTKNLKLKYILKKMRFYCYYPPPPCIAGNRSWLYSSSPDTKIIMYRIFGVLQSCENFLNF